MPITLVTGLPGHGKTLYTIARWRELAAKDGRTVFQAGIKDLKLPWPAWEPQRWRELEPGSILIVDEAQGHFPVRGRDRPPEWIEELAKHRHRGVDIVLITQNPMLIDSFVRRLVDRHFHVVRKFGTHFATIHEFPNGTKENVAASREGSIRHEWKYPKDVFDLYTSAELHTVKRRVPVRVFVLFALPFFVAGMLYFLFWRLNPATRDEALGLKPPGTSASAPSGVYRGPSGQPMPQGLGPQRLTASAFVEQHAPRVPGLAYTAPVYDEVTKPAEAPYPAACVESKTRCQCYSQQGTRLEVPGELCSQIVAGGFFVAWRTALPSGGQGQAVQVPAPAGNVASKAAELGGAGYGMAARVMPPGSVSGGSAGKASKAATAAPAASSAAPPVVVVRPRA